MIDKDGVISQMPEDYNKIRRILITLSEEDIEILDYLIDEKRKALVIPRYTTTQELRLLELKKAIGR